MEKHGKTIVCNLLPKDLNDSNTLLDAEPVFIVVENIFCVYFVIELGLRFGAFRFKRDCIKDAWFCFDALLVALMVPWLDSEEECFYLLESPGPPQRQHITIYHQSNLGFIQVFETWILTIVVVAWRKDRHE